jgi:hypothetical protein
MNDSNRSYFFNLFQFLSIFLALSCPHFTFADQESVIYTHRKILCGNYLLSGELHTQSDGNTQIEIYPATTSHFEIAVKHIPLDIWLKYEESLITMEVEITRNNENDYPQASFMKIEGTRSHNLPVKKVLSNSPRLILEKPCG